jgi:hypothetical protein
MSVVLLQPSLEFDRWRTLECGRMCIWDDRSETTWRESSSIRPGSPSVLSGVEWEMLAVVGKGVTSQILSTMWVGETRLSSVWLPRTACTCVGAGWARWFEGNRTGSQELGCAGETVLASGRTFPHVRRTVSCALRVDNQRTSLL